MTTITTLTTITSSPPPYANSLELSSPPAYQPRFSSSSSFTPTQTLQIQTPGKPWLSLPLAPRPDPIPIFSLSGPCPSAPLYTSIRPSRSSGSCSLFTPSSSTNPLSSTTYRFGPSNPPIVQLFHPYSPEKEYDSFPLKSPHLLSRTVQFQTRLGTFQWRYASRAERKAENAGASQPANSLILLERVTRISHDLNSTSKPEEVRTVIGKFLRSTEYRSEGSSASSAGNGGRLVLDLSKLDVEGLGEGEGQGEKEGGEVDKEMVEVMAVTTCLVMLKKEVDRRRAHQIMIMSGCAVGGG